MGPFINPDDIKSYIESFKKPFMNGQMPNNEEIQRLVMDSVDQFLPEFLRGKTSAQNQQPNEDYQVFETHDFVIARLPLKQEAHHPPKLLMDTYHLYIQGLPNNDKELTIKLPAPIRPKNAKAELKNGILEVRMQKRGPEPMSEISVT
ncbi:hypothetical protein JOD43_004033 [Pullulanibacillus pueri]|uniref:Hsp20/alpha crystallin family protein n=1 Tax=Pullulanibacillus pueri TaxID=1437324 RepID=A0A8J2ZZ14_9BACL|nr:Hsp20/alpha crystallin family protein [Pullulanibacillus pueri]MBM7683842.1 hypothetical protein [Pullulanibacillus pueri]GGH87717.1 hypothetical protein GCM10007096_38370 [Pullulanibacillus pueri]